MLKRADLEKMAKILGGVLVWRTAPSGAAARSGVRAGDIILSVNGAATPDMSSFANARRLRADAVALELYRLGQRLDVEVALAPEPRSSRGASTC